MKSEGVNAYIQANGFEVTDRFDPGRENRPSEDFVISRIREPLLDWMIEGAIREDDFAGGLFNRMLGCPQPENPPSETNRILNHFFDVQRGGRGLTILVEVGFPAPDWALGRQGRGSGPRQNEFSLLDAREYQYQSLTAAPRARDKNTALLFKTLGQVLHNLQDMAQPQHTRNDRHADCSRLPHGVDGGHSWYEQYVEDRTLRRAFPRRGGADPPELVLGEYEPVSTRPYREFFTDSARRGLADFSSLNFLSVGTNLGSNPECGGLIEPPCQATAYQQRVQPFTTATLKGQVSGVVTLYARSVVDALTGQPILEVPSQ